MKLKCEDHGDVTVMRIIGEFTGDESHHLEEAARQRFEQSQVRDIVIDCSALEFVDSRALETLIWLQDRCAEHLGQMRLAGLSDNMRTVLEMTRLAPRFECHEAVEPAVKSLR